MAIQPGIYNGYKEEDVVIVAFENNKIDQPVIVGKLYLGAENEGSTPLGALSCSNLSVSNSATLPLVTKLTSDGLEGTHIKVAQGYENFNSLMDIIDAIKQQEQTAEISANNVKKMFANSISKNQAADTTGFGWSLNDSSWTLQAYNSANEGLNFIDVFKADASGVTIRGSLKLEGYPHMIKHEYGESSSGTEEPTEWQDTVPSWENGKYIWQKTTTYTYRYDETLKALKEDETTDIVCLTGPAGSDGAAAQSTRIIVSSLVHSGSTQETDIIITPIIKIGDELEAPEDLNNVKIYYKENSTGELKPVPIIGDNYIIEASQCKDDVQLIIMAQRNNSSNFYDTQTVMYSPLNTPILVLDNDYDTIQYLDVGTKLVTDEAVECTAKLLLNEKELPKLLDSNDPDKDKKVRYSWSFEDTGCVGTTDATNGNQKITITGIKQDNNYGYATCTAVYKNKGYTKTFKVGKQLINTSYWLDIPVTVHTGKAQTSDIVISAKTQRGTGEILNFTDVQYKLYTGTDGNFTYIEEIEPEEIEPQLTPSTTAIKPATDWKNSSGALTVPLWFINSIAATSDIKIEAYITNEMGTTTLFESEIVEYSPESPIISLSNDSDQIKSGSGQIVSTKASVYVNGIEHTDVTFSWEIEEGSDTGNLNDVTTDTATLTVSEANCSSSNSTTKFICKATANIKGKVVLLTKHFNVAIIKGSIVSIIESSAGTNFKKPVTGDDEASTTLTARVYEGTNELDKNGEWYYEWYWADLTDKTAEWTMIQRTGHILAGGNGVEGSRDLTLKIKELFNNFEQYNKNIYFVAYPHGKGNYDDSSILPIARLGTTVLGK